MGNRLRPSLALLISALVHVAFALVLFGHASRSGSVGGSEAVPGPALMVSLVSAGRPQHRESAPAPDLRAAAPSKRSVPAPPAATEVEEGVAGLAAPRPTEHHYFGAGELTEPAVVADGMAGENVLVVPGLKPQAVALEVWISDEGQVDRVELESPMSEADRQLLLAAFAKVRFLPGRIGRIAVHSRLSMRILVDYTLRA